MLGILLLILKIIGLLCLVIAGILLALVLLVLFLPVPYRVWVSGDTTQPDQLSYRLCIFGIQILPKRERKRRKKNRIRRENGKGRREPPKKQTIEHAQPETESSEKEPANTNQLLEQQQCSKPDQPAEDAGQEVSQAPKHAPKRTKNKEKHASGNIREKLKQIYAQLCDAGNQQAARHIFSEMVYLLRHYGPHRVRADVCFSLGDPANTGYATAALSVCPFSYGKNCRILPDFETWQMYLHGWLDLRGHILGVHVLIAGLRLLFDRNIRKLIGKIRRKNK